MIPQFCITGLSAAANKQVLSISVTDDLGLKSDTTKIRLNNADYQIASPALGTIFQVWLGYDKMGIFQLGEYQLDEIRHSESQAILMEITGNAQKHVDNDIKAPRDKKWDEKTLGDIFGEIASRNGYQPKIDGEISSVYYDHLDQNGESDVAFATRIAEKHDAVVKFQDGKMIVQSRNKTEGTVILQKGEKGMSISGLVIEIPTGITGTFSARGQYKSIKVNWQDSDEAKRKTKIIGSGSPQFEVQHTFTSKKEAETAGGAKLKQLKRGTKTLETISLPGNPHLRAGMKLILLKFHPDLNGSWIIKQATHNFQSGGGYSTTIKAEKE